MIALVAAQFRRVRKIQGGRVVCIKTINVKLGIGVGKQVSGNVFFGENIGVLSRKRGGFAQRKTATAEFFGIENFKKIELENRLNVKIIVPVNHRQALCFQHGLIVRQQIIFV